MPNTSTIFEVCTEIKNWFDRNQNKTIGTIQIGNGNLITDCQLVEGQYFRIMGSKSNDGVHIFPDTTLLAETFDGAVWGMAIPKTFIDKCNEIEAWKNKYATVGSLALSPFSSESISGVYSYSKNSSTNDAGTDKSGTWQGVFGADLAPWRKI